MRLAIDASRSTVARITGTEHYALQLMRHLILQNDLLANPHDITLYFRDAPRPDLFSLSSHVQQRVIPFSRAWTHLRFAAALYTDKPDLTFVPAHTLPFVMPSKAMVTVHDLGYKLFPQAHSFSQRTYLDVTTRYSAKRADIILADSLATKKDLMTFYGTPERKIHVVYPAVTTPTINSVDVRTKYNLPRRYFVFIGTLQPRKNISRLVQAYTLYRQQTGDDAALVLAGGKGWLYDEAWTANVKGIIATGYIDEADKGALLREAIALVFPSLYEGFGFPVLEAMYCDTPVIASNTSSLPELVGEAGLLVDPLSIESIANAMQQIASDEPLRQKVVALGREQVKKFCWDVSAKQVLELLNEV